jgi:ubiquinone/menaquinone biosynthesis C-methylase UbiE
MQFETSDIPVDYIQGSCWDLLFPDNMFDLVYQVDVCLHVGGSWDSLKEMIRVSKKYVIFTGPSFGNYKNKMDQRLNKMHWGVNKKLLIKKLEKMKKNKMIKEFSFYPRKKFKDINHQILFIEKEEV